MLTITAVSEALLTARRMRALPAAAPPAPAKPASQKRSALDRRAAERYAEQAARDAVAAQTARVARAAPSARLGSVEATLTSLLPGAPLTGDLLPAGITALFGQAPTFR